MKRVTGLGGVFFKSRDPEGTLKWYRTHLGINYDENWGGFAFQWRHREESQEIGYTVWSAFPDDSKYFDPSQQPFMVNFRVDNLVQLISALKAEGVEVCGEVEEHENGKFARILDSDGRKVELWEPLPTAEDPYL